MKLTAFGSFIVVLAATGWACGGGGPTDTATSEVPPPAAAPVATSSTATPVTTSEPFNTPVVPSVSLTPAQIFERISPDIAFIQTPAGSGSGLLLKGGYVLTNARVLWPYREARVVFSDGSNYSEAKVVNWDLLGDLAVISIPEANVQPVEMVASENIAIGSELYLIGYSSKGAGSPQPAITRGVLSGLRQWESMDMTYFQTDAAIPGGQSGGVLVSSEGEVVGVLGLTLNEAGLGLVASAKDVQPRVDALIAGGDRTSSGLRFLSPVVPMSSSNIDRTF